MTSSHKMNTITPSDTKSNIDEYRNYVSNVEAIICKLNNGIDTNDYKTILSLPHTNILYASRIKTIMEELNLEQHGEGYELLHEELSLLQQISDKINRILLRDSYHDIDIFGPNMMNVIRDSYTKVDIDEYREHVFTVISSMNELCDAIDSNDHNTIGSLPNISILYSIRMQDIRKELQLKQHEEGYVLLYTELCSLQNITDKISNILLNVQI